MNRASAPIDYHFARGNHDQKQVRKAVFPAAGLGTRFLPATKALPKEMMPLVDKPIIQYGVEEAVASGCDEIIIVTGRGKTAMEDHFDISYELEKTLEERGKKEALALVQPISQHGSHFLHAPEGSQGPWPRGADGARTGGR